MFIVKYFLLELILEWDYENNFKKETTICDLCTKRYLKRKEFPTNFMKIGIFYIRLFHIVITDFKIGTKENQ